MATCPLYEELECGGRSRSHGSLYTLDKTFDQIGCVLNERLGEDD
jgi:hypothetical protein